MGRRRCGAWTDGGEGLTSLVSILARAPLDDVHQVNLNAIHANNYAVRVLNLNLKTGAFLHLRSQCV